jgi:hypothetical protein
MNDYFDPFELLSNIFDFLKCKTDLSIEQRTLILESFAGWASVFNYRYQDYFLYAGLESTEYVISETTINFDEAMIVVIDSYKRFGSNEEKLYILLNLSLLVIPSLSGKSLSRVFKPNCLNYLGSLEKSIDIGQAINKLNKSVVDFLVLTFAGDIDQLDLIGVDTELSDRRITKLLSICKSVQEYLSIKYKYEYFFYVLNNHIHYSPFLGVVKQDKLDEYLKVENPSEDLIESIKLAKYFKKERNNFNKKAIQSIQKAEALGIADELEKEISVLKLAIDKPMVHIEITNKITISHKHDKKQTNQLIESVKSPAEIKCYFERYLDEFIRMNHTDYHVDL